MEYEGPWFKGVHKLPQIEPSDSYEKKVLQVITATEGGAFDAVNMYDRMIMTNGLIQWGDAGQYAVCDMLGAAYEASPTCMKPVFQHVCNRGYTFRKNKNGKWRFFAGDDEVNSLYKQQLLYLGGSTGIKNTWTNDQKLWAKGWAAAIASVWDDPVARESQVKFTVGRLSVFITNYARATLFSDDAANADQNIVEATRAMYLSYAANLPAVASKMLSELSTKAKKWTVDWMVELAKKLTFGPKISIYPHRYECIRPHIERLWGIDLPDLSKDLATWRAEFGVTSDVDLETIKGIQEALIKLGYDVGPSGADGIWGPCTVEAVRRFQYQHGLTPDGIVGQHTRAFLRTALA